MIGYIKTYPPELKMKEYVKYNAYYCGICHSIKERWGQLPRLTLNYDCVFLAVFIDSLNKPHIEFEDFRCIVHPFIKKKKIVTSSTVDFVADMNIYMSYMKIVDNVADENNLIHGSSEVVMRKYAKRLRSKYKTLTDKIDGHLADMAKLEQDDCDNIDEVAEAIADTMEESDIWIPSSLEEKLEEE